MPHVEQSEYALSVGGSLLIPDGHVGTGYVRQFAVLLKERVDENKQRTAIVTGGGNPSRVYQHALRELDITDPYLLDLVGIHPTHSNALFLATALTEKGVRAQYIPSLEHTNDPSFDAWVTGGTKPGQTTDAVLVQWSTQLGIQTIINATNTPYIYEMDNGAIDKTRPIEELSWDEYITLIGNRTHQPGENLPFGLSASHQARDLGMSVVVLDGNNLQNMQALFEAKPFAGTVIHP